MAIEKFADTPNQGITVLDGPLSDSATTIPVKSMADLKLTGLINFAYCKITKKANWRQHPINRKESFEIVKAEAVSGDDLETVTRGVDGTSGTAFDTGDIVEVVFSSIHYQDIVNAITDGTAELNIGALTVSVGNVEILAGFLGVGVVPLVDVHVRGTAPIFRLDTDAPGATALTRTMSGIELLAKAMNTTNKYSGALKFMSTDPEFTTENPKFLGAIVPRATEGYGSDDAGGMAIDFFTTPNNPGATSVPVLAVSLDQNGDLIHSRGNLYWVGAGTGIPFGFMYVDGAQTIIVALTVNTPAEVKDDGTTSANDGWLAGEMNLFTMAASDLHYFSPGLAGKYEIVWDLSFNMASPGANVEIHGGIAIDGTPVADKGEAHRTIANNTDTGNMCGLATLDLAAGAEISLWLENTTNSADVTVHHGNVTAKMVGG